MNEQMNEVATIALNVLSMSDKVTDSRLMDECQTVLYNYMKTNWNQNWQNDSSEPTTDRTM